jgi:hypothetical protein
MGGQLSKIRTEMPVNHHDGWGFPAWQLHSPALQSLIGLPGILSVANPFHPISQRTNIGTLTESSCIVILLPSP